MSRLLRSRDELRRWPARRWLTALLLTGVYTLLVAVPTDLVDTPVFGREVPPTWWSWPALLVSAALAAVLTATYIRSEAEREVTAVSRGGMAGGVLTFFAVGCPVCNKLVLIALGSAGAMTWFEPVQPLLQVAAIGLLLWALQQRLSSAQSCRVPASASADA